MKNTANSSSNKIFQFTAKILEEEKKSKFALLKDYYENLGQIGVANFINMFIGTHVPFDGIRWAAKYYATLPPEYPTEIVDVVKKFYSGEIQRLIKKAYGNDNHVISRHKDLSDLQNVITWALSEYDKEEIIKNQPDLDSDYDCFLEYENYYVLLPKTKKASVYFGNGTSWCVSYTPKMGLTNMFYRYALQDIFLTFFIHKSDISKTFCVGVRDGAVYSWGKNGSSTVWSNNKGFAQDDYSRLRTEEFNSEDPLAEMIAHYSDFYNNEHPSKELYENPTDEFIKDCLLYDIADFDDEIEIDQLFIYSFKKKIHLKDYLEFILPKKNGEAFLLVLLKNLNSLLYVSKDETPNLFKIVKNKEFCNDLLYIQYNEKSKNITFMSRWYANDGMGDGLYGLYNIQTDEYIDRGFSLEPKTQDIKEIKSHIEQKNKTKFNNTSMNLFKLINEEIYS